MSIQASAARRARFLRAVWQAPIVVALLVLAIAALGGRIELLPLAYLALVTPELCRVDAAEHRLPNALVLPGLLLAAAGPPLRWVASGTAPTIGLLAGAGTGLFLMVMHVAGGLGMGDVKLGTALGLCLGSLGPLAVVAGPAIGFLAGGAAALVGMLVPSLGLGRRMPFGPFLLFGFWAAVVLAVAAPPVA